MNRRHFLLMLGIGAAAASTTVYFDMGKNLWRQENSLLPFSYMEDLRQCYRYQDRLYVVGTDWHNSDPFMYARAKANGDVYTTATGLEIVEIDWGVYGEASNPT